MYPTDILDHIVSFLHADRAALRACCDSHPLLSRLAARYLYSHILLNPHFVDPPKRPSDLANLLSSRPYIGRHCVRSLKIELLRRLPKQPACWEALTSILPALSALNKLTMDRLCDVYNHKPSEPVWQALPETFRQAFLNCLRLPTLRHLSIIGVPDFPWVSLLQGDHPALEHLTVERGFACEQTEDDSSVIQTDKFGMPTISNQVLSLDQNLGCGVSVKALSLRSNDENFLESFVPWATTFLPRIQSLDFGFRGCSTTITGNNAFTQLCRSYSNTLTNLCLDIRMRERLYYYDIFFKEQLNEPKITTPIALLSCLPHLEILTIQSSLMYESTCERQGLYLIIPWINQLFIAKNRPPWSRTSVKSLSLHLDCNLRRLPSDYGALNLVAVIIHKSILELVKNVVAYGAASSCGEVSAGDTGSIGVEICFGGGLIDTKNSSTRNNLILTPLYLCEQLSGLVERGVLSIKSLDSDGDVKGWVQDSFPDL